MDREWLITELNGKFSIEDIEEVADYFIDKIQEARSSSYKQACEDCAGALGKLAVHLMSLGD